MTERVEGTIFLLNEEGESEREICVLLGTSDTIGGTFGSLIIDMIASPPKVQGKGNVWIREDGQLVRTKRMEHNETLTIAISANGRDSTPIGTITYTR